MQLSENSELTPLQAALVSQKLIEAAVVSQAWTNEKFLSELLAHPLDALVEAGIPVPEGKTIRVIQEQPNTIQVVLPAKPEILEEASDEELDAVAGGALIDNGKCATWDGINKSRSSGKISDFEELFFKGCTVVSGLMGVSWGWM